MESTNTHTQESDQSQLEKLSELLLHNSEQIALNTKLYRVSEVAQILKTNEAYVYKLYRAGVLRFIKLGSLKCRKETLDEFLAKYDGMDVSDPENIIVLAGESA